MNKFINSFAVFCILNAFCLIAHADTPKNVLGNKPDSSEEMEGDKQDNTPTASTKDPKVEALKAKKEADKLTGDQFVQNNFGIKKNNASSGGTTNSSNISPQINYTGPTTSHSGGTYETTTVTYTANPGTNSTVTNTSGITIPASDTNVTVTIVNPTTGTKTTYSAGQTIPYGTAIGGGSSISYTY